MTVRAGQRRSGRDALEASREAALAADSTTNWPSPIVVPASASSMADFRRQRCHGVARPYTVTIAAAFVARAAR